MNTADYRPEPPEPWEVLGFRRFDKVDWYGLAGAERFLDGSEPLVAYAPMDGRPDDEWSGLEFVIDGKGIGVSKTIWGPDDDDALLQEFRFIEDLYDARSWLEELAQSGKPLSWAATDDKRWTSA